jgi:dipeptidyl aminopeptidase/acylaminoacyl peptidase
VITLLLGTVACVQRNATVQEASIVARMTHGSIVLAVAFSPDGRYVVSGSWDDTARVWEAASGREVARVTHGAEVSAVTFSPDGRYVVSGSGDDTVRVWWWRPKDPDRRVLPPACRAISRGRNGGSMWDLRRRTMPPAR